ncbi:Multiple antibiotic resistance protein MarA [compost metagenome]
MSCLAQSENAEYNDHKRQLLARIHRFIEDNLARDVSLQSIADHVNLHAVYLSSMYKQETGDNLSEYIMRYRMEQAAVLLRSTEIKIYELASRLGFQNPPYFSKLFKNYYGITPQEYRDRLL